MMEKFKEKLPAAGQLLNKFKGKGQEAGQAGSPVPGPRKKGKKKKVLRILIPLLLLAVILLVVIFRRNASARAAAEAASAQNTATVERRDITSELSSSGTLQAKETYSIVSLVEGEILSADFEEGDQVEKDQVLFEIDKSSMESELTSATNRLSRAQSDLEDANEDYEKALSDYSGNTYKATESGYISELHIHAGDRVNGGTSLADLYSDDVMDIRIPFLSGEAAAIGVGNEAVLTLTDTGEQIVGTVKAIANQERTLTGGRLVRYVTITVNNPGGLTDSTRATAQIGDFIGSEDGVFEATVDTTMTAVLNTTVEVESLLVNEGDYVTKGTPIFRMTADTAEDLIEGYEDAVEQAEESVESAQTNLESTQDSYDNYTITAPISGEVITKNYNVGDTITRDSNSDTTLAVIYDLSSLTFEMSIDELDIQNVKVGQNVTITADAFSDRTYTGTVTNVSLESTYSNGVTTYPVTVTLNETDDLLPGMNVDGVITLDEAQDALTIPVDALMRGNQVYVQDSSVTQQQGPVPAGFRAVEVETGLTNDSYVEILSGLSEGDVVYVAESTASSGSFMMPGGGGFGGGPGGGGPGGGGPGGGGPGGR